MDWLSTVMTISAFRVLINNLFEVCENSQITGDGGIAR